MHNDSPDRFDSLADKLPFAVDDYDTVREVYVRWRLQRAASDLETIQTWSYLYALRYLYARFRTERTGASSDLDMAVLRAVQRIYRSLESVRDPERFPQFVSVICRRVLLSHRERRRELAEINDYDAPVEALEAEGYDRQLVRHVLQQAIERLPASLRTIARMRLIDECPYDDIAEATGHPVPTVRTYVSRSLSRLRQDPDVRALYPRAGEPPGNDTPR
ncbi:MAG: sigma-70 family RNA polymerase sigma factor [Bacteroidota bacterium]